MGWLVSWLVGWSVGGVARGWFVGGWDWFGVGWLVDGVGWLVGWFNALLVVGEGGGWLVDELRFFCPKTFNF